MATAPRMSARIEQVPPPDDNVARLRVPPHSREAEQAVLGGLLQDNAALVVASELLTEADFYGFEHRLIFAAIAEELGLLGATAVLTAAQGLDDAVGEWRSIVVHTIRTATPEADRRTAPRIPLTIPARLQPLLPA